MPSNNTVDFHNPLYDPVVLIDVHGASQFIRSKAPREKQGAVREDQFGGKWVYGKASVAIAGPTPQPAPTAAVPFAPLNTVTVACDAAGVITAGATYTAWAGFDIGEYGWVKLI